MRKPTVFLGSSSESRAVIDDLILSLDKRFNPYPWYRAFKNGKFTLERLIEITGEVDLAVFVFASNDTQIKRSEEMKVARDNVYSSTDCFKALLEGEGSLS